MNDKLFSAVQSSLLYVCEQEIIRQKAQHRRQKILVYVFLACLIAEFILIQLLGV